jgi:predicted transposase YdaD
MSKKPFDEAFKYLAEKDAKALLLLLGAIRRGERARIKLLPREVSVSAQLPDQPYEVTTGGNRRLVHVEAQTVYDPNLPDRMLEYAVRLWLRYRLPIASYVLLLTNRGVGKRPARTASLSAGNLRVDLKYTAVCLWRISARDTLALKRENLLPFVPLMRGGTAELEKGARGLGQVADETRRQELSLHFLMLGGLRYNREELLDLVGRESMIPLEQLRESSFYQYILDEGREEGLEKGLEKGREEGAQRAAASMLRGLIEQRFGQLPDSVSRKIEGADFATLEKWSAKLLAAGALDDIFAED